jgi:hypothetical protein
MQEFFEIECTLEELYEYNKHTNSIYDNKIYVSTKFGKKCIENIAYTAYNEPTLSIRTETEKNIKVSNNHILYDVNGIEIKSKDLEIGNYIETTDGYELITYIESIGNYDLMDIQVDDVHEYYANGIRSHNSTISDVIKFAIYGRLEKKKLRDLANRLNKNAYVHIDMITKKGKLTIERGIEPSIFDVWINDVKFDKAGKKSVQDYLEEEILEMPFYVFSNTLSLSINDFKSFLTMNNHDKKTIIDKIFGLQMLNQMRELIKGQIKKLKSNMDAIDSSISAFEHSLTTSTTELETLEEQIKQDKSDKIVKLNEQKLIYEDGLRKCLSNLEKIEAKYTEIRKSKVSVQNSISDDRRNKAIAQEKIDLYKNSKCPVCESDLDTDFHTTILKEYQNASIELDESMAAKTETLNKLNENLKKLESLKTDTERNRGSIRSKLNLTQREIDESSETIDDKQLGSLRKIIKDAKTNIDTNKKAHVNTQKEVSFYGILDEILGDKGVKQLAIKTIVPPLNVEIGRIVKHLGVDHKIIFNEEFDAKITHFGIEVSPETLSTGEMKKVDFAVLLAVIKMMKIKYPYLNLLFLDEIFSSIDGDGQYYILKILRESVKDYGLNIFVISHYPLSYSEFDYKIEVTKANGFSQMEIKTVE